MSRELEEAFGVKLTDSIISEDERWGPVMKTMLRQKDRYFILVPQKSPSH